MNLGTKINLGVVWVFISVVALVVSLTYYQKWTDGYIYWLIFNISLTSTMFALYESGKLIRKEDLLEKQKDQGVKQQ